MRMGTRPWTGPSPSHFRGPNFQRRIIILPFVPGMFKWTGDLTTNYSNVLYTLAGFVRSEVQA